VTSCIISSPVWPQGLLQHDQLGLQASKLVTKHNIKLRYYDIIWIDIVAHAAAQMLAGGLLLP
jgi:hypothetical protein